MIERKRLGNWNTVVARNTVYQLPDAVETESSQIFEVVRQRVFFDEVTMVTLHRERTATFLVLTGLYTVFFTLIAVLCALSDVPVAAWIFGAIALPGAIAFLVRASLGVDIVTVIGRRSRASVRFALRKARARQVYADLCAAVLATHRRLEREYAALAPQPAAEAVPAGVPMPPASPDAQP